jgi:hypothetical protein
MIDQCEECGARMSRRRMLAHRCPKAGWSRLPAMGRRLREFRRAMGWSQRELATRIRRRGHRCSRSMIDKLEWQVKVPSFALAKCIRRMMLRRGFQPALLHPLMNRRD